jgi:hypothetical protein
VFFLAFMGFGIPGLVFMYFYQRNLRLNRDRDQHHLASMLVSIASGRDEVGRDDVRAFLTDKGYSIADRLYRLNHAVKLAGTAVRGPVHDRVVALARELRDAP